MIFSKRGSPGLAVLWGLFCVLWALAIGLILWVTIALLFGGL